MTAAHTAAAGELGTYPGGKSGAGVAQQIAALFPPHVAYTELFLGHGGVLRHKRPALHSYGFDTNIAVVNRWHALRWPGLEVSRECGVSMLERFNDAKIHHEDCQHVPQVIYADPPYPHSVRSKLTLYGEHEWNDAMHARFLAAAVSCDWAALFVSTYDNEQYTAALAPAGFERHQFQAMTRGGVRTETLWYRIPESMRLASWAPCATSPGRDYREREKIKRRNARWVRMFRAMKREQRVTLLGQLIDAHAGNEP